MGDGPELTIAIATRERPGLLAQVLRSCGQQRLDDGMFEILVVADGESEGTAAACEQFASELAIARKGVSFRFIEPWQESHGLAAARNVCTAEARGRYLRFQDDDDVIDPYAADAMLNAHFEFGSKSAILGYTGIAAHIQEVPIMRYLAYEGGELFNYRDVPPGQLGFDWFWGGRTSVATKIARSIPFDEELRFGAEDIEFAFRACHEVGMRVSYWPYVRSFMIRAVDLQGFARRCFRQGQAARYAASKHPGSSLEEWAVRSHAYVAWSGDGTEVFAHALQRCRRLELLVDFTQQVGSRGEQERRILHTAYQETFGLARALGFGGIDPPIG